MIISKKDEVNDTVVKMTDEILEDVMTHAQSSLDKHREGYKLAFEHSYSGDIFCVDKFLDATKAINKSSIIKRVIFQYLLDKE